MEALVIVVAFVFGTMLGSFTNVVVTRVPRGESIVHPPSRCPSCGAPVRPYDNVPVVSWLALRGRCRACGWAIPARYVVVELTGGVVLALLAAVVLLAA